MKNIERTRLESIAIYTFIIAYFIFNALHYSNTFAISHDSIYYYSEIISDPNILFPHHLFFVPFMSFVSNLIGTITNNNNSIFNIIVINNFFGCLALVAIYKYLKNNLKISFSSSFFAVVLSSLSYGFWLYNCNIETYTIPLAFAFLSIYFYTKESSNKTIAISAILGGIAVLFHQLYGLYFIIVIIHYIITKSHSTKRFITFALLFNGTWLCGYLIALIVLKINTLESFLYWFFLYHFELSSWSSISTKSLILPFFGFFRAIFTSHGLFLNNYLNDKITTWFHSKNLADDIFIAQMTGENFFYIYILLLTIFIATILFIIIKSRHNALIMLKNDKNFKLLLIFFIVFAAFFSLWDSANLEFWIPQSIIFMLLISILVNNFKTKLKYTIFLSLTLALFINNYTLIISKINNPKNDMYFDIITKIEELVPDNTLLINNEDWIISKYFEFFSKVEFIKKDDENIENLTIKLNSAYYDNIAINDSVSLIQDSSFNKNYVLSDSLNAGNKKFLIYKKI